MKLSQKLARRIFLLLSPLLLATTMGECNFLFGGMYFLYCFDLPPLNTNAFGYGQDPPADKFFVGDEGLLYASSHTCEWQLLETVKGKPDLNDITYKKVQNVGNIIVGENGTIYQKINFSVIGDFITNPAGTQDLYAIQQDLPSPNIIAVGDSGTVIKSTDNGLSWSVLSFPDLTNLRSCNITGDYILVGGDNYSLYQSSDCGETWKQINIGDNYNSVGPTSFNAIFFYDENVGYIGGSGGLMGKTTDRGANWTTLVAPDFEQINDLFFISPDSGVAVGSPGIVRFTADGGTTWEEEPEITSLLAGSSIKKISALSEEFGIAVTDSGFIISFATDSSLLTAVNEDEIHIHNYSLSNNYPNPFNPSTIIEYSLPQYGFVTLIVYDMLGREIATLVNEEKPIGSYEVEFDAIGLTSGIYFYRLRAGDPESSSGQGFVETKKMVLLR